MPKFPLLDKYPNLRYVKSPIGGHFNALEVPDLVAKDIIKFINLVETEARKPKQNNA